MSQKKFSLLGYPLTHSLSPEIHRLFAKQFAVDLAYDLHPVLPEDLLLVMDNFFANGGHGLNITAPYKELAFQHLTTHTSKAKIARAVNTIFLTDDGSVCGDNTDGDGLINDLTRHAIPITRKRVLILGAGGAVRGILQPLLSLLPSAITLVNRDVEKAELLARHHFAACEILARPYSELSLINADVIIHAISTEPKTVLPDYEEINFLNTFCYDLNYINDSTFIAAARAKGAKTAINGLGMLVEQAAQAFYLWHRCIPNNDIVLAQLQQTTG